MFAPFEVQRHQLPFAVVFGFSPRTDTKKMFGWKLCFEQTRAGKVSIKIRHFETLLSTSLVCCLKKFFTWKARKLNLSWVFFWHFLFCRHSRCFWPYSRASEWFTTCAIRVAFFFLTIVSQLQLCMNLRDAPVQTLAKSLRIGFNVFFSLSNPCWP